MKQIALTAICVILLTSCSSPCIDATSNNSIAYSVELIKAELSEDQTELFDTAFKYVTKYNEKHLGHTTAFSIHKKTAKQIVDFYKVREIPKLESTIKRQTEIISYLNQIEATITKVVSIKIIQSKKSGKVYISIKNLSDAPLQHLKFSNVKANELHEIKFAERGHMTINHVWINNFPRPKGDFLQAGEVINIPAKCVYSPTKIDINSTLIVKDYFHYNPDKTRYNKRSQDISPQEYAIYEWEKLGLHKAIERYKDTLKEAKEDLLFLNSITLP